MSTTLLGDDRVQLLADDLNEGYGHTIFKRRCSYKPRVSSQAPSQAPPYKPGTVSIFDKTASMFQPAPGDEQGGWTLLFDAMTASATTFRS